MSQFVITGDEHGPRLECTVCGTYITDGEDPLGYRPLKDFYHHCTSEDIKLPRYYVDRIKFLYWVWHL